MTYLGLGTAGDNELQPILRRVLCWRGEDVHDVPVAHGIAQGNHHPVHPGSRAMIPHLAVHGVREVDGRGSLGQGLHVALGREDEHLFLEEIDLDRLDELAGILQILLPLHQLVQPGEGLAISRPHRLLFLVLPVRRDPLLRRAMHLGGSDLHFHAFGARADDRRVQRLVQVRLGKRDVVLESPGDRGPVRVDDP